MRKGRMRSTRDIHNVFSTLGLLIIWAAFPVEALETQVWSNGEVHPWGTALRCSPFNSTTLTSTNGIAVGGLAPVGDSDGDTVNYSPRASTDRQRWNIYKDTTTNAHRFVNVASGKCLDGWDQIMDQAVKQYDCDTGTQLNQEVYLEYVQAVPDCNPEWSTYRLRVGSPSSTLCVTQQRDSRAIFSPCLSTKTDPSQNYFIQNGVPAPPCDPQPPVASANFDINQRNRFNLDGNGLGSTVWPGDSSVEVLYSDLRMSSIRLWVDNYPDTVDHDIGCDAGTPALVTKAWNNFDPAEVISSATLARLYDVQVLIVIKRVPALWNNTDKSLKTQCERYVGDWWVAAVTRLRNVGVDVKWIELVNEPNYCGDVCMAPDQYARVVNVVFNALQERGLGFIKIVGPGASIILNPDEWVAACGNCQLSGWGVHPYEGRRNEWLGSSAAFRSGFISLVNQMWSVNRDIPIYALEMASNARTFHGRDWTAYNRTMDTWSDTNPYWARVAANMVNIYSAGASGTHIWESADQAWRARDDLWGIINSTTGFKKAGFYALKALSAPIPRDAAVLTPLSLDSALATAVFVKPPHIVVAIVNDIDTDKTATVFVRNARVVSNHTEVSLWTANGQNDQVNRSICAWTEGGLFVRVRTVSDSIVVLTFNLTST